MLINSQWIISLWDGSLSFNFYQNVERIIKKVLLLY